MSIIKSETKWFSEQSSEKAWNDILLAGSRSKADADLRKATYSRIFSNAEAFREMSKQFSGYSEIPILSNQYFNATMASYVRSFAGFLAIERDMAQPTMTLYFNDLVGVSDNRMVLPNLGKENIKGINSRFQTTSSLKPTNRVVTSRKLIPGYVEITLVHALDPTNSITIRDDRKGNLLSPSGILVPNPDNKIEVDYAKGIITFSVGSAFNLAMDDTYSVIGYEDTAGSPDFGTFTNDGRNRFKLEQKNMPFTAEPDMLIAETNIMAMMAQAKAMGINQQEIIGNKLTELYTKLVNEKLVKAVEDGWHGNVYEMDSSKWSSSSEKYYDFGSRMEAFQAELIELDLVLAKQSIKASQATCYLVGATVGNYFRKLRISGGFTDSAGSTYINDLLGYYAGVPVLRHMDIAPNEGYAIEYLCVA
jgi:hypothetical protein